MMNEFFIYLTKSVISISILYITYRSVLKKTIDLKTNRVFLIVSVIFSVLVPMLNFYPKDPGDIKLAYILEVIEITGRINQGAHVFSLSDFNIILTIYKVGVLFFLLRFLANFIHPFLLIKRYGITNQNGTRIVDIDGKHAPFSFFNIIFIHRDTDDTRLFDEIIAHEQVHVDQHHTIDNIITEFLCILQWFNPLVWMYKKSVREIHEYLADKGVILKGFDTVNYKKLMLYNSFGVSTNELTNYFDNSIIKKRIIMLTRQSYNSRSKSKLLILLPALIVLAIIFYNCDKTTENGELASSSEDHATIDQVYDVVDVMPIYEGGIPALRSYIAQQLKYPAEARKNGVQGKVYVEFVVNKKGKVSNVKIADTRLKDEEDKEIVVVGYGEEKSANFEQMKGYLEEEAIRVVKSIPDFTPGEHNGNKVNVRFTLPIAFAIQ